MDCVMLAPSPKRRSSLNSYWFLGILFCTDLVLSKKNETHGSLEPLSAESMLLYYKLPITVMVVIVLAGTSIFVSRLVDRVYNIYKDNWAIREDVTDVSQQTKDLIRNKMRVTASMSIDDHSMTNARLKKYIDIWVQRVAKNKTVNTNPCEYISQHSSSLKIESVSDMVDDSTSHVVVIEVDSSQSHSNNDLKTISYI